PDRNCVRGENGVGAHVGTGVSSPITHVLRRKTPVLARPERPSCDRGSRCSMPPVSGRNSKTRTTRLERILGIRLWPIRSIRVCVIGGHGQGFPVSERW